MKLGAFDYLTKPCELEDLLNKVREAVKNKLGE
jgi:DNA-binding NtrC family response regulator